MLHMAINYTSYITYGQAIKISKPETFTGSFHRRPCGAAFAWCK